ncbi:MAG: SCO family protein, partial [Parasphingopyxis sp.]
MNDFGKAFLGAALCALAACSGGGDGEAPEPPLAGASIGGDFELTGESGETVRESDFEGDYRLVYFGYT